jgi:hypothetical protein
MADEGDASDGDQRDAGGDAPVDAGDDADTGDGDGDGDGGGGSVDVDEPAPDVGALTPVVEATWPIGINPRFPLPTDFGCSWSIRSPEASRVSMS